MAKRDEEEEEEEEEEKTQSLLEQHKAKLATKSKKELKKEREKKEREEAALKEERLKKVNDMGCVYTVCHSPVYLSVICASLDRPLQLRHGGRRKWTS